MTNHETARDAVIAYAAMTRTVTADGLGPLLDAYRDAVLAAAPAAASVPPPAPRADDQAALRQRIARALEREDALHWGYDHSFASRYGVDEETDGFVDAVLAVLPDVVDRAAAYRLAVTAIEGMPGYPRLVLPEEIVDGLRRLAAEAQPEDRPRCPHCQLPHDLDSDSSAVTACASIRASIADAPTTTKPETEPCAHCGKAIRRITGTLAQWWVHEPGGHTICQPEYAASSPRATPRPAAGVRQDGAQPS